MIWPLIFYIRDAENDLPHTCIYVNIAHFHVYLLPVAAAVVVIYFQQFNKSRKLDRSAEEQQRPLQPL